MFEYEIMVQNDYDICIFKYLIKFCIIKYSKRVVL